MFGFFALFFFFFGGGGLSIVKNQGIGAYFERITIFLFLEGKDFFFLGGGGGGGGGGGRGKGGLLLEVYNNKYIHCTVTYVIQ